MNTVEIWSDHPESPSELIERWALQDGKAILTYMRGKRPLYPVLGNFLPDQQGEKFLRRLIGVIENSSYMQIKVT